MRDLSGSWTNNLELDCGSAASAAWTIARAKRQFKRPMYHDPIGNSPFRGNLRPPIIDNLRPPQEKVAYYSLIKSHNGKYSLSH